MRLIDGDVIFLLHPLDQLFDQLIQLAVCGHLLDLLPQILVEHFAIHERLLDGPLQFVQRLFALGQLVPHRLLKAALQKVIRKHPEQILHAHFAGWVGHVF